MNPTVKSFSGGFFYQLEKNILKNSFQVQFFLLEAGTVVYDESKDTQQQVTSQV